MNSDGLNKNIIQEYPNINVGKNNLGNKVKDHSKKLLNE
jgi:hypothetical protein